MTRGQGRGTAGAFWGSPCPLQEAQEPHAPGTGIYSALRNDSARIRPGQPGFPDSAPPAVKLGGFSPSFQQHRHQHTLLRGAGSSPIPATPLGAHGPSLAPGIMARQLRQTSGNAGSTPKTQGQALPARGLTRSGQSRVSSRAGCGPGIPAHPDSLAPIPVVFFLGEIQEKESSRHMHSAGLPRFPRTG